MSEENVRTVRDHFATTNEGDFALAMGYYADDVELIVPGHAFLENGTFRGKEAVGRWFGDWFRTFRRGYHFDLEEVRDLGDVVLVVARHGGRGKSSGAEVRATMGYLYGVQEGKIVRWEDFGSKVKVLEAAGLSKQDARADT